MGNILNKKRRLRDYNLPLLDIASDTVHLTVDDKDEIMGFLNGISERVNWLDKNVSGQDEYKRAVNEQVYTLNEQVGLIKKDLEQLMENQKIIYNKMVETTGTRAEEFEDMSVRDPYYQNRHNKHNKNSSHYENDDDDSPFLDSNLIV